MLVCVGVSCEKGKRRETEVVVFAVSFILVSWFGCLLEYRTLQCYGREGRKGR
jgi:hypothetical protein